MSPQVITLEALWDALRLQCCAPGLSARRIVLLTKEYLIDALAWLEGNVKGDQRAQRE